MLERYRVPVQAARLKSERGQVVMWMAGARVLIQVASGHGDAPLAELFVTEQERLLAGKRDVRVFYDGLEFAGYDSNFRARLAESGKRQVDGGQVRDIYVLTRSKLVAMGAAVVNLALGSKIQVLSDTKVFEDLLAKDGGAGALNRVRAVG